MNFVFAVRSGDAGDAGDEEGAAEEPCQSGTQSGIGPRFEDIGE